MAKDLHGIEPLEIIRFNDLRQYLPVGRTVRDQLIRDGLLEAVPLTPGGRAKGITKRSIREYQIRVMGLADSDHQDDCDE